MRGAQAFICTAAMLVACTAFGTLALAADRDWENCLRADPNVKITACSTALERGSAEAAEDRAIALNSRGYAYLQKGQYNRAISDHSAAIRLNPNYADAIFNRGLAYRESGEYDQAIEDYNRVIRLKPDYANAFYGRGRTYEAKGEYGRAIADYEAALRLDPKLEYARKSYAEAQAKLVAQQPVSAALPQAPLHDSRVALVIGNSAYSAPGIPALPNPARDARAVAQALRDDGFRTVTLESNLGREQIVGALRSFATEAATADWAVVYYAGHGIEMDGTNYLVPVDAKLGTDRDVRYETVSMDDVMAAVEGAKRLRLVILDACRNNPFVGRMKRSLASRSIGRGLAQVEPEGGVLVAYAAKHGQVALDGDGENSPFVSALVKRLRTPGLEVRRLFDLVRDDVLDATGRTQQPFTYGSLSGREDFYFLPLVTR